MTTKPLMAAGISQGLGLVQGMVLTLILALVAKELATLPVLGIMGSMVLAIVLGFSWRSLMGIPEAATVGINYTSKKILRYGIILMGLRLDIPKILAAGPQVILLDILAILIAMTVISLLGKKVGLNKRLATLIAVGTGICGAAAIAAAAPVVKARDDETAISVAIIALLGTLFTIIYTLLYPLLNLTQLQYGLFAGSTLHELAHVIAAAQPGGVASVDLALLVKLGRVALLVPVVLLLGVIFSSDNKREATRNWRQLPVPWFILGFLALSAINTANILPPFLTAALLQGGIFLLTMAMAGLGLNVSLDVIRKVGTKSLGVGLAGSLILSITGWLVISRLLG